MTLGAFSISLPVEDLAASAAFYAMLGFQPRGGDAAQGWLILQNPDGHLIGLFKGMFDRPMLTFTPGWDQNAAELPSFTDVRDWHAHVTAHGATPTQVALDAPQGPGSFVLTDPDGNPVLIDQFR